MSKQNNRYLHNTVPAGAELAQEKSFPLPYVLLLKMRLLSCNNQYIVLYLPIQLIIDYYGTSNIINEGG